MKKFTISEALKEINQIFPIIDTDNITSIKYADKSENKFVAEFLGRSTLFIDLDEQTYRHI